MFNEENMLYTLAVVISIAAFYFMVIRPRIRPRPVERAYEPLDTQAPVANDKIIIASNISLDNLKEALIDYCSVVNSNGLVVVPLLIVSHDNRLTVTFPFDVDFLSFCEIINYIVYAPEVEGEPLAIGWATFGAEEELLPNEMADKNLMVFVPEEDENYQQLFMVSADNLGCHLHLIDPKKYTIYTDPEEPYVSAPLEVASMNTWQQERIDIVEIK